LTRRETWLYNFLAKLLANDAAKRPWLNLLDESSAKPLRDQYSEGKAPKYAKVDMYHYKMSAPLWKLLPSTLLGSAEKQSPWWTRTYEEGLIPIVELGNDQRLVRAPVS
jgi:Lipase maturation factor